MDNNQQAVYVASQMSSQIGNMAIKMAAMQQAIDELTDANKLLKQQNDDYKTKLNRGDDDGTDVGTGD